MSKLIQRLLIFFIGIPVVLGIIFIDAYHHLALNLVLVTCSILASMELYKLFKVHTKLPPKPLIVVLSALMPIGSYLLVSLSKNNESIDYSTWFFLIASFILMAYEVFSNKTFEDSNKRVTASVYLVFYAGFLFTFITRMTLLENSKWFIGLYAFTVFITDSLAWFFGVLFGKNNRGVVAASPNKSIAGFLGGYAGAVISCVGAMLLWPEIFGSELYKGVILGLLCATAGITGDLIESVFKRSAEIKDSGTIVPGRGGILDSIDSCLFTAPIYYILIHFLHL